MIFKTTPMALIFNAILFCPKLLKTRVYQKLKNEKINIGELTTK